MIDLIFASSVIDREKVITGSEMEFLVGATKINFRNLETSLGLDDLMQAAT